MRALLAEMFHCRPNTGFNDSRRWGLATARFCVNRHVTVPIDPEAPACGAVGKETCWTVGCLVAVRVVQEKLTGGRVLQLASNHLYPSLFVLSDLLPTPIMYSLQIRLQVHLQ